MAPLLPSWTDTALAGRLQRGELSAFEEVFHALYTPLVRFAYRVVKRQETAEELVQEVFGRLWMNRERIEVMMSVRSYLYRAVRNAAISVLRQSDTRREHEERTVRESSSSGDAFDVLNAIEHDEMTQRLQWAIRQLPEHYREILHLKWYDELSHREIAAIVGVSEKAVERQAARAVVALRALL